TGPRRRASFAPSADAKTKSRQANSTLQVVPAAQFAAVLSIGQSTNWALVAEGRDPGPQPLLATKSR
ncbi:hypothetical protein, partial [Nitrospira sp. BLG_2]|uniref:hypothetical protein n=1 Tax=Nitrospira sp. BLG_2 TaxID=3397507 RepID=UPI003B9B1737